LLLPGGLTDDDAAHRAPAALRPAVVEPAIYERWMAADAFRPPMTLRRAPSLRDHPAAAERDRRAAPGHAARTTVEDTLIRYHRMRGDDTLWLPGVDHSGIAAQFVLDKIIAEEGETRASLGREGYLERMWLFMNATRETISLQHRRLGRERRLEPPPLHDG
jgi:valyl-tRNA synthetase